MTPSAVARNLFAAGALVMLAMPAAHAEAPPLRNNYDGNWHFTLTPYVWIITGVSGELNYPLPGGGGALANAGNGSIFSDLKFAFMATGGARKDNWTFFADYVYADLGNSRSAVKTVTGPNGNVEVPIDAGTKSGLQQNMITFAGGHSLYHTKVSYADAFVGARFLDVKGSLDFNFTGPLNLLPMSGSLRNSEHSWDAIIGVRGHWGANNSRWFLSYYGDVGTGQASLTGQLVAGPGYAFDWGDLFFVARYLHYSADKTLIGSMDVYGPALGATFYL